MTTSVRQKRLALRNKSFIFVWPSSSLLQLLYRWTKEFLRPLAHTVQHTTAKAMNLYRNCQSQSFTAYIRLEADHTQRRVCFKVSRLSSSRIDKSWTEIWNCSNGKNKRNNEHQKWQFVFDIQLTSLTVFLFEITLVLEHFSFDFDRVCTRFLSETFSSQIGSKMYCFFLSICFSLPLFLMYVTRCSRTQK